MSSAEQRLNRLEEQHYFQEQTIEALHLALTRQQAEMDDMARRLALAETRLRALAPLLEEGGRAEPPPHYG